MRDGGEVVEDYRHLGLTLRAHPLSFLREELRSQEIVTCAEAVRAPDGKLLEVAGIVLVRQRPGSAKGVIFITIEDETGVTNLVVWPDRYEKQRRIILSAGMMGVHGRVQREGEVVHLVVHRVTDLSNELASVGGRELATPASRGNGNQTEYGRGTRPNEILGRTPRDTDLLDDDRNTIKVKGRNFR